MMVMVITVVILVIKKYYIDWAWSLELLGTSDFLVLPGYGGYCGYHGYQEKNMGWAWSLELLGTEVTLLR